MGASSGIFKGNVRIIEIRKPHKRRKLVYNAAMPLPASLVASIVSTILEMAAQRENFINLLIDEGELLPEAVSWKCPRSLDAEIRKGQA